MPAYYAIGYLSEVLFRVTNIGEYPHAKTPNAGHEPRLEAEATSGAQAVRRRPARDC